MGLGSILNVIDHMRYNITKLIKSITLLNNNKFSQILTYLKNSTKDRKCFPENQRNPVT